jgi:hypothetical protein
LSSWAPRRKKQKTLSGNGSGPVLRPKKGFEGAGSRAANLASGDLGRAMGVFLFVKNIVVYVIKSGLASAHEYVFHKIPQVVADRIHAEAGCAPGFKTKT